MRKWQFTASRILVLYKKMKRYGIEEGEAE